MRIRPRLLAYETVCEACGKSEDEMAHNQFSIWSSIWNEDLATQRAASRPFCFRCEARLAHVVGLLHGFLDVTHESYVKAGGGWVHQPHWVYTPTRHSLERVHGPS